MTDDLNRSKSSKSTREAKRLASDRARIGQVISGRYELLDLLGRGGMGAVYKARHLSLERIVAIKFLLSDVADDPEMRQRFLREASASGKINHPNVVELIDYGEEEDGCMYIVMEFLEGVGLDRVIKNEGALPAARAVNIFEQICTGVAKAHAKGIIHRDLKPSNIMLVREHGKADFVKIVDFGLAKTFETGEESQRLTQSGEVFGSPIYMSPEQCLGQMLDARSDIYSLGILMYETLTAKVPFLGAVMAETIARHLQESPRSFVDMRPDLLIPEQLEAVVMKAIAKDPDERQSSMLNLKDELADPDLLIFHGGRTPAARGIGIGGARVSQDSQTTHAPNARHASQASQILQTSQGFGGGDQSFGNDTGGFITDAGSHADESHHTGEANRARSTGNGDAAYRDRGLEGIRAQGRVRKNSDQGLNAFARLQAKMSSPLLAIGCLLSSLMLAAGVYLVLGSMQNSPSSSNSTVGKNSTPTQNPQLSSPSNSEANGSIQKGTNHGTVTFGNSSSKKNCSDSSVLSRGSNKRGSDAEDSNVHKVDTASGANGSNQSSDLSIISEQKLVAEKHKHHKSNNLAEIHEHKHGAKHKHVVGEPAYASTVEASDSADSAAYAPKRHHDWQDFSYGVEQKDAYTHSWSVPMAGSKTRN
jgi:serine/threonine protein kinase